MIKRRPTVATVAVGFSLCMVVGMAVLWIGIPLLEINQRKRVHDEIRVLARTDPEQFEEAVIGYLGAPDPILTGSVLAIAAQERMLTAAIEAEAVSRAQRGDPGLRRQVPITFIDHPIAHRETVKYLLELATDPTVGDACFFAAKALLANSSRLSREDVRRLKTGYHYPHYSESQKIQQAIEELSAG